MPGSSQGTACPDDRSTHLVGVSPKRPTNCGNAVTSWACRGRETTDRAVSRPRERVEYSDATTVLERVQSHAATMRLRGARRMVLSAVLTMLCRRWSKIADDKMRLAQLVEVITEAGGRRYDLKTVGRALASLAADDLIVYRAARGRGARAFVAIHAQFVEGVQVLERDSFGRVIVDYSRRGNPAAKPGSSPKSVTFSGPTPLINQTKYPPTPRNETQPNTSRPIGVNVSTTELRGVLANLPEPLRRLPRHLRFKLGAEIHRLLQAGWLPTQILDILAAPMPADLQAPWKLAMWRLGHNVVGSGPRLAPLQRAWDVQTAATEQTEAETTTASWHAQVEAVTSAKLRAQLLRADEVKFGRRSANPVAALAGAGRRVARLFPEMGLAAALQRWAQEILAGETPKTAPVEPAPVKPTSLSDDLLRDLAIGGECRCVLCGSNGGVTRPQLPLEAFSNVCNRCWPHIAAELDAGGSDEQVVAA